MTTRRRIVRSALDGDTSLAIDTKSHETAMADPSEQLTETEGIPRAAVQHRSTQQRNQAMQGREVRKEEKGEKEEKEEKKET